MWAIRMSNGYCFVYVRITNECIHVYIFHYIPLPTEASIRWVLSPNPTEKGVKTTQNVCAYPWCPNWSQRHFTMGVSKRAKKGETSYNPKLSRILWPYVDTWRWSFHCCAWSIKAGEAHLEVYVPRNDTPADFEVMSCLSDYCREVQLKVDLVAFAHKSPCFFSRHDPICCSVYPWCCIVFLQGAPKTCVL